MVLHCLSLNFKPSSSSSKGDETPAATSSSHSSPALNTNANVARREYSLAVQSNSYNEIWSTIHLEAVEDATAPDTSGGGGLLLLHRVLQPNRECVEDALRLAKPSALTRLASAYFDHSETTTHLCLLLHRSLLGARSLYSPLQDLLDLLPAAAADTQPLHSPSLSQSQCDRAFQVFLQFDSLHNPFPSPDSLNFDHICAAFAQLKLQLDRRLRRSRSALLLCRASVTVAAVSAVRTLATLLAGPSCPALPGQPPPPRMKEFVRVQTEQLDAAAMGAFVLNNDLRTIDRLVARLHSAINEDKLLVRLGLERGPERHFIQEVIKQLRKNHLNIVHQLKDLEEHICLCFNTVNRARSRLLQHIYRHQTLLLGDRKLKQREGRSSNSHQDLINSPG